MKKIYKLLIIFILIAFLSGCDVPTTDNNDNLENNELVEALNNNKNYTYTLEYIKNKEKFVRTLLYDNDNFQYKSTVWDSSFLKLTLCYDQANRSYYMIESLRKGGYSKVADSEFDALYKEYFQKVLINALDANDFTYDGATYSLIDSKVDEICNKLFTIELEGDYISLDLIIDDGYITKMLAILDVDNEEVALKVEFSQFNSTVLQVPPYATNRVITDIIPNEPLITIQVGYELTDVIKNTYIYVHFLDGKEKYYISDLNYRCDNYDMNKVGTYELLIDMFDTTISIIIELIDDAYYTPTNIETLNEYADRKGLTYGIPSIGDSKVLVIPVDFTDYRADSNMKANLEKAFFGTSEDTGWESLTSYYYKSSYGKLNIDGTVLDVFHTGKSSLYYDDLFKKGERSDYIILKAALEHYDNEINYDEYDTNNDGYIDAIYLVYTAPISYDGSSTLWWAYTTEYYTEDYEYYDNVEADFYCFLGYDFLFETPACEVKLKLNTEAIIHETGHLLGLTDYYDYYSKKGPSGGLGGGDMMDHNIGDHNPFSKILLGWITPTVVRDDCTLTLESFAESGQCIIFETNFTTIYSEYYLIDFYTPTGLNEFENGNNGLFSIPGIRIYYIRGELKKESVINAIDIFKYDNSYTDMKLIGLVEADSDYSIRNGEYSENDDLFSFGNEHKLAYYFSFVGNKISETKIEITFKLI